MAELTYTPPRQRLRGLSRKVAECYGKPHVGAHYRTTSVKSNALDDYAHCACCGLPATNSHHCPPLHFGRTFTLATPCGIWTLKPSLIALCGSGTTGCHNGFHGGARYEAEWEWHSDEFAEDWWEGRILRAFEPHEAGLYQFGHWVIWDKWRSKRFEVRA